MRLDLNRRFAALSLGLALATGAGLAQEPKGEAELARAFLTEETDANDLAAELYGRIAADPTLESELRLHARIGQARCLRRSGELDSAAQLLEAIDADAMETTTRREIEDELTEIASLRRVQDAEPDEIEKKVLEHLAANDKDAIVALGRAALPALLRFLAKPVAGPAASGCGVALAAIVDMKLADGPTILAGILEKGPAENRQRVLNAIFRNNIVASPPSAMTIDYSPVLRAALADSDANLRRTAAQLFAQQQNLEFSIWKKALEDSQPGVRQSAFESMLNATTLSRDQLLEGWALAIKDPSAEVRRVAVGHLRQLGDVSGESLSPAVATFLSDSDVPVRRSAIQFTPQLPQPKAHDLQLAAFADEDAEVRRNAVRFLRTAANDVDAMRTMLFDADAQVRTSASSQIMRNFPPDLVCSNAAQEARLVQLLEDPDRQVRQFAMSLMSLVGSIAVKQPMLDCLTRANEREASIILPYVIRHDLAEAMPRVLAQLPYIAGGNYFPAWSQPMGRSRNMSPQPLEQLFDWLEEKRHLDEALTLFEQIESIPTMSIGSFAASLASLTGEGDRDRVLAALRGVKDTERLGGMLPLLTNCFGEHAGYREFLVTSLSSPDSRLRLAAANSLSLAKSQEAVTALIEALSREKDADVLSSLRQAVVRKASAEQLELLRRSLDEGDEQSRRYFIDTLGAIATPEAGRMLLDLLDRGDVDVTQIFQYLGRMRTEGGLEAIIRILESGRLDSNSSARRAAIVAIGAYRDPAQADRLVGYLGRWPQDRMRDGAFSFRDLDQKNSFQRDQFQLHPALRALFDLGAEAFLSRSTAILAGDREDDVQSAYVKMMAFLPQDRATLVVKEAFTHRSIQVRAAAAKAAGEGLMLELIDPLRGLVRSADEPVRTAAEDALLRFARFRLK